MKAAQLRKYHKNNINLELVTIEKPKIGEQDVLIKVTAAGVNPLDNMISRGEVKMIVPYKVPLIAGNEVVGIIEELGSQVKGFNIGERIYARMPLTEIGAFAEYAKIDYRAIAKVPDYLSDTEAASIPLTALTIMQALDLMKVEEGKSIFISGGTGGVGAMAIPIAKSKGLTVITSGSVQNKERVESLGADQFIDYKTQDYTNILSEIDYVLDTLGGEETKSQMSIMKKGGQMVSLKAMPNRSFAKRINLPKWKQLLFGIVGQKYDQLAKNYHIHYHFIFVESNGAQLQEVSQLLSQLSIKPSIDSIYSFDHINLALKKVAEGHSRGKTVITFDA